MKTFYEKVDKFSIHKIISIDETSIHADMTASYSRCELGRRCVKKTKDNKVFKKYTLVSAISSKGIVGWILYESGGMTSNRMVEFINKFIKDKFKNYLVIMDNGGAHKSNLVKEAIINSKNKLLYSVPYRPKTNAIEMWFNQIKHSLKLNKKVLKFNELKEQVKKSIKKVNKINYINYFEFAYNKKIYNYNKNRTKKLKNYK